MSKAHLRTPGEQGSRQRPARGGRPCARKAFVVYSRRMQTFRAEVEQRFRELRDRIVARLEELESGAKFERTSWQRPGGGGGEMSEIRGELFEKGGCNFSAVAGERYPGVPEGEGAP